MKPQTPTEYTDDQAIVVPALLWWMGVPVTLLIVLWLFGIL